MIIYAGTELGVKTRVYKDGVELTHCFEVDSEGTYALCYKLGPYGHMFRLSNSYELATERIENVTVVIEGEE
jgi:hypothetical protein